MKTVAQIISYIFHPLLITTYLVLLLRWCTPRFLLIPAPIFLTIVVLIFILTFVLPVANLILFKAFGTVSSLQMASRQERIVPFILITVTYAAVAGLMIYYRMSLNFNRIMIIVTLMVLCGTVATFFQKVSVHTLAIVGVVGILLPLNKAIENGVLRWPTIVVLTIAGLVMSSRLYLNAHTPREILTGALIGFFVGFFGMVLLF